MQCSIYTHNTLVILLFSQVILRVTGLFPVFASWPRHCPSSVTNPDTWPSSSPHSDLSMNDRPRGTVVWQLISLAFSHILFDGPSILEHDTRTPFEHWRPAYLPANEVLGDVLTSFSNTTVITGEY